MSEREQKKQAVRGALTQGAYLAGDKLFDRTEFLHLARVLFDLFASADDLCPDHADGQTKLREMMKATHERGGG